MVLVLGGGVVALLLYVWTLAIDPPSADLAITSIPITPRFLLTKDESDSIGDVSSRQRRLATSVPFSSVFVSALPTAAPSGVRLSNFRNRTNVPSRAPSSAPTSAPSSEPRGGSKHREKGSELDVLFSAMEWAAAVAFVLVVCSCLSCCRQRPVAAEIDNNNHPHDPGNMSLQSFSTNESFSDELSEVFSEEESMKNREWIEKEAQIQSQREKLEFGVPVPVS